EQYPQSEFAPQAASVIQQLRQAQAEEQFWLDMQKSGPRTDTVTAFLRQFPDSGYRAEAETLLLRLEAEAAAWPKCRNLAGSAEAEAELQKFLARFPQGQFVEQAKALLAEWEQRRRVQRAEDERWREVEKAPSAASITAFLEQFPQSRRRPEADTILRRL